MPVRERDVEHLNQMIKAHPGLGIDPEQCRDLSPDPLQDVMGFIAMLCLAVRVDPLEPKNFKDAMESLEKRDWDVAMDVEIDALVANLTWSLVERPTDRKVLAGRWVFKIKRGANNEILKRKARWVVRGD